MLTAAHLTRRFGPRVAVDDVSFTLARGEIFALLGPNGAGKTTTLRMLAGLIDPSSGAVEIDGTAVDRHEASRLRSRVGFLTEAPGLWDRMSVRDNLLIYARLHGLPEPERAVDDSLALFEIRDRAADPTAELSKGLKQRVALARTLLHHPDIILLDEPTSGLDPESAREVRELILGLRADHRAVVLSTHNLDEVSRVADRVAVLRAKLIAVDTPAALRARLFGTTLRITMTGAAAPYVSVLSDLDAASVTANGPSLVIQMRAGSPAVPAIVRRLVEAGASIESVAPEVPPLEEVYIRLLAQADGGPT